MSKPVKELLTQYASMRLEILKKLELDSDQEYRVHILERLGVPWIFSAPRATVWAAAELPKADVSDAELGAWISNDATHFALLFNAELQKPALWEVDGTVAVLYAHRYHADLLVLMFLDPARRGEDSMGLRIHEVASRCETTAVKKQLAALGVDLELPGTPSRDKETMH